MRNCLDGAGPRGEKCRCTQDRPQGHLFGRSIAAAAATAIPSPAATLTGTSAATAVAAPAAAAVLSRFGLINRQSPALDLFAVERLDPYQASVWCALGETRLRLEKKKGHSSLWIEKGALDFVGRLATGSFHQC